MKHSLSSAIVNRLKHKGSIKSVNSINLDFVDNVESEANHDEFASQVKNKQQKTANFPQSPSAALTSTATQESQLNKKEEIGKMLNELNEINNTPKSKSIRFARKSNLSLASLSSGYFTTGRYKKTAPSIG